MFRLVGKWCGSFFFHTKKKKKKRKTSACPKIGVHVCTHIFACQNQRLFSCWIWIFLWKNLKTLKKNRYYITNLHFVENPLKMFLLTSPAINRKKTYFPQVTRWGLPCLQVGVIQ